MRGGFSGVLMPSTITPNMSLVVPTVGQEPGPQYATDVNASLNIVDGHNHTPGYGVPVPTAGLNINADLPINDSRLLDPKSIPFTSQSAPLPAIAPDIDAIYVSGVDLYYNDGNGNQIRITQGGSVTGAPGSITGLTPPASVTYSSGSETFTFQSNVNTPANIDVGSVIIRDITANSHGITLSPPSGLAADYSVVFPGALPSSQSTVEIDTAGNLSFVANTTPGGPIISGSSGMFSRTSSGVELITNFSITITTSGRPVILGFIPDGNAVPNSGYIEMSSSSADSGDIYIYRGDDITGTIVGEFHFGGQSPMQLPPSSVLAIDVVGAGTYTYNAYVNPSSAPCTISVFYSAFYAYEL
jgi:hypothetical protein